MGCRFMKPDMIVGKKGSVSHTFHPPLYYEDFEFGLKFQLPSVKISSDMILRFGLVTGDRNSLHTDEEFAKTTLLKGAVAHGRLAVDVLFGVLHKLNFWEKTIEALRGFEREEYLKPIRPGDYIHYTIRMDDCVSAHPSNRGIILFGFEGINQNGETVVSGQFTAFIRKRVPEKLVK